MNAFEKIIAALSPKWAASRAQNRAIYRQYAAAETNRLTGSKWGPPDQDINDIILSSARKIRQRARDLERNFAYVKSATDKKAKYLIGDGFVFQSKIRQSNGEFAKKLNQKIEERWNLWAKSTDCDRAKKSEFVDIMNQASRDLTLNGEAIFYKHIDKNGHLSLKRIESDRIGSEIYYSGRDVDNGNEVNNGIEFDKKSGQVKFYHYVEDDGYSRIKTSRIPADRIIHMYQIHRADQLRGIPDLVASMLMSQWFREMMESELSGARMASQWVGFFTQSDKQPATLSLPGMSNSEPGLPQIQLENGMFEYLPPGWNVDFSSANRPGDNFFPFIKLLIQMFCSTSGMPYELVSNDYLGMNFATMKVSRNDFRTQMIPEQGFFARHLCNPIQWEWLQLEVLRNDIKFPLFSRPEIKVQRAWMAPQDKTIDVLRATKAELDEVAAGVKSEIAMIIDRNQDPEDVIEERKRWIQMQEEAGLPIYTDKPSTAQTNNPAAIQDQKAIRIVSNALAEAG